MRCRHFNSKDYPEINTEREMSILAKEEKRYDVLWGVVHPGNAIVHSVHRRKEDAEKEKRLNAYAYVVVKVVVTPIYQSED